jgi:GNAT superfamily N-acetyltransferase
LEIWKVDASYWKHFKPHYYLDLPMPIAAEYYIGTVGGELVAHLAVCPRFNTKAYRGTRLVVMPEWQGAGVGTRFLNWVCAYHRAGKGRCGKKFPTYFHTSHPQLCQFLKRSRDWKQVSAALFGVNKKASAKSISKSGNAVGTGYGGHFRAIQGFKYIGPALP